jgi:hypothetical protein
MNPPESNDPLDALLREQNTYIEDDGFSRRVMARLPPGGHRTAWLREALILGSTSIGCLLAILWVPLDLLNVSILASFNPRALLVYMLMLAIIGSLVWGVVAALGLEE